MADQEEDFNSLPLIDRWVHKVWKVRKQAYEDASKQFEKTPDEHDPAFRPFLQDPSLFKSAVADSNVAAQQDGIAALCAFLKFGGREGCLRTRGQAITPILEKGLSSTRAATKASSLEALLLFIELDVPGPVIDDVLPILSAKQPKVIAAALAALTQIFHNYGCKTADPKPVLKVLPKVFGHADKNVRAEATNLTIEFYRWLRDAMKPMIWNELKPAQQAELETQFEKIRAEPPPKQERLLRSQQEAKARTPAGGEDDYDGGEEEPEEPAEIDVFDLAEPQDVLKSVPASFHENIASTKWKDRKEALEGLSGLLNVPRIKDGDFGEINRALAKSMKDANIAVVIQAAQCLETLAKGLRKAFGKYRTVVMQPILERLKEKKATVTDALGAALDQVFLATNLTECLEDITTYMIHKNPQVKEGTAKFLIRCLRTTRDVPSKPEITSMVESAKKLLAESTETLRASGAEILGTIMKIIGERGMNAHLEGLDDIRKNKIKEYFDVAEVKAKERPKPIVGPKTPASAAGPPKRLMGGKKAPAGAKKPAAAAAAAPVAKEEPLAPQPTSRPAAAGGRLGMPKPSGLGGLKPPAKRALAGPGTMASPRRPPSAAPPDMDDEPEYAPPPPQPKLGMGRGGLAGRSLAKPSAPAAAPAAPPSPGPSSGLTALERAELEELRAANDRLTKLVEESRHDRSKLMTEIQELKNQNAGLIEDHTRDVLSIKAKETQLVRARSDAEAAESTNERLRRELERLKRALGKAEAMGMQTQQDDPRSPAGSVPSPSPDEVGIFRDGSERGGYGSGSNGRNRISYASTHSEEKENGDDHRAPPYGGRSKMMSPELRYANSTASSGRGSPARGFRREAGDGESAGIRQKYSSGMSNYGSTERIGTSTPASGQGVESWKRAAEVTSQLKARIEQMKAKQGLSR